MLARFLSRGFALPSFRSRWLALELAADAATLLVAFGLAFALHAGATPQGLASAAPPPFWLALALALHLALSALLGSYARAKQLLDIASLRGALIATSVGWAMTSALLWILREPAALSAAEALPRLAELRDRVAAACASDGVSRVAWSLAYLLLWPLSVLSRRALFALLRSAFHRGLGDLPAAIVGTEEEVRRLRRRLLRAPVVGERLCGCITPNADPEGGPRRLGGPRELAAIVTREGLRRLWIAGDPRHDAALAELARVAREASGGRCEIAFALERVPGYRSTHAAFGEWLTPIASAEESSLARALKRGFDLALALPMLLLALPLLALLALLVRASSPGGAFVAQRRAGEGGRPFLLWKLRTMHADAAPGGGARKPARDPRVTALGRWLRRFSLDELPQLWNVVRGEMSLVGPRPELWEVAARYDEALAERLRVKPGLTGLWQVSPARHRPIHEEIDYDLCYVRAHGFWMDLTILLLTPGAVLWGSGAR
ncbi:MAG: sugar transferase [Planctomycetes bacterium]|nr:sugar transferase [Planctomycetota bacterium]